jgi:hypothetical protein
VSPASPAETAVREAARSAFDEAAAEEAVYRPDPPSTPYPAPGAEIGGPPLPPGPVRAALPGRGKRGPGCGAKRPVGWLASDGCLPLKIHECERRECPRCARPHRAGECELGIPHGGGEWAHEEGLEIAAKLQGYAVTQGFGPDRPLRQVIVSPPVARYDENEDHDRIIERVRRAAAKALRELGWEKRYWDSLIVHHYRGCEGHGYDRWGPHAHAVGPGVDVRRTEEYWLRTGGSYWMNPEVPEETVLDPEGDPLVCTQGVVVKQAKRKDGSFASYWSKSLVRHLVYELGHAAIVPNGHAVSYIGKGLTAFAPRRCDRCGAPLPASREGSLCAECSEAAPEEPNLECQHGTPLRALGDGSHPKHNSETREWTFRIDRDRFFRFLDRAPAQGGPLLETVDGSGRAVPVAISPYLAGDLRPPPYSRQHSKRRFEVEM